MNRPLVFIALLAFVWAAPAGSNAFAQDAQPRTWRIGKFEIVGSVKSLTETEIVLTTKARESVIAIEKLSAQDRAYLQGVKLVREDGKQFKLVSAIIDKFEKAPEDGIEFLIKLGKDEKFSPYAPFAAGVALATLKGDFKAAKRQFLFAKIAIARNQKVLGKGYHAETEAAINNNIAVCLIKQFKSDDAVELLLQSADKGIPGLLARHNRDILLEISDMPNSQLRLGKRGRKNLLDAQFEEGESDLAAYKLPNRYMISTAWQQPLSERALSQLLELGQLPMEVPRARQLAFGGRHTIESLKELDAYPDLWCADCRGSGTFTCRHCTDGKAPQRVKKYAGDSPNGSGPMYQYVTEMIRCTTCQGRNVRRCEHCDRGRLRLDR